MKKGYDAKAKDTKAPKRKKTVKKGYKFGKQVDSPAEETKEVKKA